MTHLQKITTLAKKIRKQYPNKKWTDCVKAASNELKAGKKVAGYNGTRRDGNKTTVFYTNKKIGALPVNLHGSFLGYKFKVINQFTIEGKVEAQIVHDDKIISYIDGTKQQLDNTRKILIAGAIAAGGNLLSYRGGETKRDIKELERNIGKFVESLNNEVKNFNSGKDVRTKTQKPIKLTYKPETKKLATIDKVKKILFDDRKRLQHGYKLVPAKKLTMKKIAGEKHTDTKSHNINVTIGNILDKKNKYHENWIKEAETQLSFWKTFKPEFNYQKKEKRDALKFWNKLLNDNKTELNKIKRAKKSI